MREIWRALQPVKDWLSTDLCTASVDKMVALASPTEEALIAVA